MAPRKYPAAALELLDVQESETSDTTCQITFVTDSGNIQAVRHLQEPANAAVLWVFGAGGGLGGPAGGIYERLARQLVPERVASLRLDYRLPGKFLACVLDVLLGISYLERLGLHRVVLVGHSFGGAVVIHVGAISPAVRAVAALSSQTTGTELVADLSPKPLLLIHGEQDEVLPVSCSQILYRRARDPKQLITYPHCGHGLDECREPLDHDLFRWLMETTAE